MMPSLRKKVAGFIRHLSVNNQAEAVTDEINSSTSGCFIHRYLNGDEVGTDEPTILHGRSPQELPRKTVGPFRVGADTIMAAVTGPDAGLTTVNKKQRHLSTSDPDVDYIDILDSQHAEHHAPANASTDCIFSQGYGRWFTIDRATLSRATHPIDNTVMHIRAAGSVFSVGGRSREGSRSNLLDVGGSYQSQSTGHILIETTRLSAYRKPCDQRLEVNSNEVNQRSNSFSTARCSRVSETNYRNGMYEKSVEFVDDPNSNLNQMKEVVDNFGSSFSDEGGDAMFNLASFDDDDLSDDDEESSLGDCVIPPPAQYATSPCEAPPDAFAPLRKSKSAPAPFKRAAKLSVARADNSSKAEEVAGVLDWQQPHVNAYGAATTLYEKQPLTQEHAGNPIADCFGLVARRDSAVLALADGVNWGEKACVAARSAVHGCVEHLNKALFSAAAPRITNTMEVFIALLRSFHAAHSLILQEDGMLTTLTAAVVLPLATVNKYVLCVCNVGDSLAYVYSSRHGVREVTKGSHDIHCMRDMRDALGALGPVDGQNPELNNLTCSMTELDATDIVFVTSDGVSDNFDPVVGKFAVLPPCNSPTDVRPPTYGAFGAAARGAAPGTKGAGRKTHSNINKGTKVNALDFSFTSTLPTVQAYQRHELSLLRMDDMLKNGVSGLGPPCDTARSLCDLLLDFATRLTAAKRHILEDPDLYYEPCPVSDTGLKELGKPEQRARRKKVLEKLAMVPGKLDHATVVAYKVGMGMEDLRETNL